MVTVSLITSLHLVTTIYFFLHACCPYFLSLLFCISSCSASCLSPHSSYSVCLCWTRAISVLYPQYISIFVVIITCVSKDPVVYIEQGRWLLEKQIRKERKLKKLYRRDLNMYFYFSMVVGGGESNDSIRYKQKYITSLKYLCWGNDKKNGCVPVYTRMFYYLNKLFWKPSDCFTSDTRARYDSSFAKQPRIGCGWINYITFRNNNTFCTLKLKKINYCI